MLRWCENKTTKGVPRPGAEQSKGRSSLGDGGRLGHLPEERVDDLLVEGLASGDHW